MIDQLLFVALPYAATVLAVVMTIHRYCNERFTYSSLSSQLLENNLLAWASVAWHYAILLILTAHLLALVFPGAWAVLLGGPIRLELLEITGMGLALLSVVGLALFVWRRVRYPRVRHVTSAGDWLLLIALLLQVGMGFLVAFVYRWGGLWYVDVATPWLASLVRLNPQITGLAPLPWLIKLHFAGGFVLLALLPFTRLIHAVTYPLGYLWRPYRQVIWNRRQA